MDFPSPADQKKGRWLRPAPLPFGLPIPVASRALDSGFILGLTTAVALFAGSMSMPGVSEDRSLTNPFSVPQQGVELGGEGPRLLIRHTAFETMAEVGSAGPSGRQLMQEGHPELRMEMTNYGRAVMAALQSPALRRTLELADDGTSPGGATNSGETDLRDGMPKLAYPNMMVPGSPSASAVQFMNRSNVAVQAGLRARIVEQGVNRELCEGLHVAATIARTGEEARVVWGGPLMEMADPQSRERFRMEPRANYEMAIVMAPPLNAGNEYQGKSCSVEFLVDTEEI
ncbi:MAG: hypothetical protein ACOC5K_00230 [Chloroflexota bacterium]